MEGGTLLGLLLAEPIEGLSQLQYTLEGLLTARPHTNGHFLIVQVKRKFWNQVWSTPVTPAVRRVRQENCCEFEANLHYTVLGKPGLQNENLSQKQKQKSKQQQNQKMMTLNKTNKQNKETTGE